MIVAVVLWVAFAAGLVLAVRWLIRYSLSPDSQNGIGGPPGSLGARFFKWGARDSTVGGYARQTKEIMQSRDRDIEWYRKTHPVTETRTDEAVPETQTETSVDPWRHT